MDTIPKRYQLLYPSVGIGEAVSRVAIDVNQWLRSALSSGESLLAIGILDGALFFFSDLLRGLGQSVEPALCRAKSYSTDDNVQGSLSLDLSEVEARGRTVLLVDDICDTGATLRRVVTSLTAAGAKEVRTAVLIRRMISEAQFAPDWAAIEHTGEEWFVGYGMDDRGTFRNLPDVYSLSDAARTLDPGDE